MKQFSSVVAAVAAIALVIALPPAARGVETTYYTPPHFKYQVKPVMPESARAKSHTGTVMLKILVGADGKPKSFAVFKSSGFKELDGAALAAVRASTYIPAKQGSKAVVAFYDVSYRFTLQGVAEAGGSTTDLERRLSANPRDVNTRLLLARKQLMSKSFAQAESVLNDGVKSNPSDARLWAQLGIAYFEDGLDNKDDSKYKQATEAFDKALALDSRVQTAGVAPVAYYMYGVSLVQKNQFADALPYAQKATQLDPKRADHRVLLAIAEARLGRYDAALSDLKAAQAADDHKSPVLTVKILTELGNTYFALNRESEGLAAINEAQRVDARNPGPYEALVGYYQSKGNAAAVLTPLNQLALVQPDNPRWQVEIGTIYLQQKSYDKAKAAYDKALAANPRSGDALFGQAELAAAQGRIGEADGALQKAIAASPQGAAAYNAQLSIILLGGTADRADHTADAVKYARAATQADPNYASGWLDLGVALGRQGNKSEGGDALRKAYNLFKAQGNQGGASAASDRYKELTGSPIT